MAPPSLSDLRGLYGCRKPVEPPYARRPLGGEAPLGVEAGMHLGDDAGTAFHSSICNYGWGFGVGCIAAILAKFTARFTLGFMLGHP